MNMLKKIPLSFKGELHDIQLINFSVEREEVLDRVPTPLRVKEFEGRALISMVNVHLKKMRLASFPPALSFAYQHIGFRLLVEDKQVEGHPQDRGIYFLDSFTQRPLMAWGGSMLTDYRLQTARLWNHKDGFSLRKGEQMLSYEIERTQSPEVDQDELLETVGAIDRAYSKLGDQLRVTQIQREKWPLAPLKVSSFKTNFFETARLEGAFRVDEVIYYQWLSPQLIAYPAEPRTFPAVRIMG